MRDLDTMINAEDKLFKSMKHDEVSKLGQQIHRIFIFEQIWTQQKLNYLSRKLPDKAFMSTDFILVYVKLIEKEKLFLKQTF